MLCYPSIHCATVIQWFADRDSYELSLHYSLNVKLLLPQVALWSFPQDEKQVQAFANLTDRYSCWERGIGFIRDNRIREMWQVGRWLSKHLGGQ